MGSSFLFCFPLLQIICQSILKWMKGQTNGDQRTTEGSNGEWKWCRGGEWLEIECKMLTPIQKHFPKLMHAVIFHFNNWVHLFTRVQLQNWFVVHLCVYIFYQGFSSFRLLAHSHSLSIRFSLEIQFDIFNIEPEKQNLISN